MATHKALVFAGVLALSASSAQAQSIGFGGSLSFSTDYVASGESQTGQQPAVQFTGYGYVPSGFFAGIFLSNVDFTGHFGFYTPREEIEIGLFAGWEGTLGNGIGVEVGYEYYIYQPVFGACCGFFTLDASIPLGDRAELGGWLSVNPANGNLNARMRLGYELTDAISLRAMLGHNQSGLDGVPVNYMNLGVDYGFTDALSASLDFHNSDSAVDTSALVLGLTFSF